ncbi:o-succinylbenzoate synthase [Leucobacter denitrificans]|uniref:o-succinylbenzoate synthase n=1 Tax=Leucobacter denitrificans TaxID=683042 RepID=UPI003622F267
MTTPTLQDLLDAAHVVAIPTRTRFRGISVREAVIFEGSSGASEFSPFTEYDDAEASRWLQAAIEFGWGELPELNNDVIAVNATVPAVAADEVAGVLARFPGCTTAKVKVAERGQALADDVDRVRAVREELGPEGLIRVDANGNWSVDETLEALSALSEFGLDYAEQPCATIDELAEVRAQLGGRVRIAADESVRKAEDPLAVARAGAADLLIVKAQPLGGITSALRIIEEAELPVVVSSALDTSVGISMGLHLAAALPDGALAGACGLGTVALLEGDIAVDPLLPLNGELSVRRPALNLAALSRYRADNERETWWRERIERCFAQLARETAE